MLNYKNKAHVLFTGCVLYCWLFAVMSVAVLHAILFVVYCHVSSSTVCYIVCCLLSC